MYFALTLTDLQRYRHDAGIGTLVSMTLPIAFAVLIGWTLFFLLWNPARPERAGEVRPGSGKRAP